MPSFLSSYPFHLLFLFHISIYLYSSFYSLFLVVAYQSSSAINQQNSTEHMMCTIAYLCHHVQELFLYCSCLHSTITSAAPHNDRKWTCGSSWSVPYGQETMHLTSMFYLILPPPPPLTVRRTANALGRYIMMVMMMDDGRWCDGCCCSFAVCSVDG